MPARLLATRQSIASIVKRRAASAAQLTLFAFAPNGTPVAVAVREAASIRPSVSNTGNYRITPGDRIGLGSAPESRSQPPRDPPAARSGCRQTAPNPRRATDPRALRCLGQPVAGLHRGSRDCGRVGAELQRLLAPDDYAKGEASGGSVLEPALGVGHLIGLLPEEWAAKTRWTGIELDPTTARIARALYPECDIRTQAFEEAAIECNSYDLGVSNVPFGRYQVHDPVHNPLGFRIHHFSSASARGRAPGWRLMSPRSPSHSLTRESVCRACSG